MKIITNETEEMWVYHDSMGRWFCCGSDRQHETFLSAFRWAKLLAGWHREIA